MIYRDLTDKGLKSLYKGFRVFYGDYISNPDVLFVGINPGAGHDQEGEILVCPTDFKYHEDEGGTLANETIEVFRIAGLQNILNNATKTNYYYPLTCSVKELHNLTRYLNEKTQDLFSERSAQWTKELIRQISPKVIICEGKSAYEKVLSLYDEQDINDDWSKDCASRRMKNGYRVIGYCRRYSNIKNKDELVRLLTEEFPEERRKAEERKKIIRHFITSVHDVLSRELGDHYAVKANHNDIDEKYSEVISVTPVDTKKVRFAVDTRQNGWVLN